MKLTADRPFADPEAAARKLLEIVAGVEAVQDGRIHIEKINAPMFKLKASPAEYNAGLDIAIAKGCTRARLTLGRCRDAKICSRRPLTSAWQHGRSSIPSDALVQCCGVRPFLRS
jgi:hypothetical protein